MPFLLTYLHSFVIPFQYAEQPLLSDLPLRKNIFEVQFGELSHLKTQRVKYIAITENDIPIPKIYDWDP